MVVVEWAYLKRDASWDIPWQELSEKEEERADDEEDEPNLGPDFRAHDPSPDGTAGPRLYECTL